MLQGRFQRSSHALAQIFSSHLISFIQSEQPVVHHRFPQNLCGVYESLHVHVHGDDAQPDDEKH